jgi:hypothetical protein
MWWSGAHKGRCPFWAEMAPWPSAFPARCVWLCMGSVQQEDLQPSSGIALWSGAAWASLHGTPLVLALQESFLQNPQLCSACSAAVSKVICFVLHFLTTQLAPATHLLVWLWRTVLFLKFPCLCWKTSWGPLPVTELWCGPHRHPVRIAIVQTRKWARREEFSQWMQRVCGLVLGNSTLQFSF